ncbi:hypothetical protein PAHAL_7G293700 [Panicum hallii]|uniref:Uncharacterized protein n=1 Tax=Panicum hallii TaxID=206008 RepID=A0A2T8IDU5_9POAL|nr:hypothetical protein PAHAL_7G293700 [Panicum hallii]
MSTPFSSLLLPPERLVQCSPPRTPWINVAVDPMFVAWSSDKVTSFRLAYTVTRAHLGVLFSNSS